MSEQRHGTAWIWLPVGLLLAGVLLYAPLLAALVEDRVWGSNTVYDCFDRLHLAEPLGYLYTPTVEFFAQF